MKKLLIASIIAIASINANASNNKLNNCKGVSKLATSIMTLRQSGVPVVDALGIVKNDGSKMDELVEKIVLMAYEQRAYSTKKYQDREIKEFGNQWFVGCMKN